MAVDSRCIINLHIITLILPPSPSPQSKAAMSAGVPPRCLMDFWMVDVVRETAAAEAAGQPPPPFTSDWEVGQHIFDFLFAAQDASTSSLVWLITLLESHPEVRISPCDAFKYPPPSPPLSFTSDWEVFLGAS